MGGSMPLGITCARAGAAGSSEAAFWRAVAAFVPAGAAAEA